MTVISRRRRELPGCCCRDAGTPRRGYRQQPAAAGPGQPRTDSSLGAQIESDGGLSCGLRTSGIVVHSEQHPGGTTPHRQPGADLGPPGWGRRFRDWVRNGPPVCCSNRTARSTTGATDAGPRACLPGRAVHGECGGAEPAPGDQVSSSGSSFAARRGATANCASGALRRCLEPATGAATPVFPVKGQMLSYRGRSPETGDLQPRHLVPREDGRSWWVPPVNGTQPSPKDDPRWPTTPTRDRRAAACGDGLASMERWWGFGPARRRRPSYWSSFQAVVGARTPPQ